MKFLEKYNFSKEMIADFMNNSPEKLQNAIKEKVKMATDLEVKEVNIKIKDITSGQEIANVKSSK